MDELENFNLGPTLGSDPESPEFGLLDMVWDIRVL